MAAPAEVAHHGLARRVTVPAHVGELVGEAAKPVDGLVVLAADPVGGLIAGLRREPADLASGLVHDGSGLALRGAGYGARPVRDGLLRRSGGDRDLRTRIGRLVRATVVGGRAGVRVLIMHGVFAPCCRTLAEARGSTAVATRPPMG
ncbi:hypothetical protein GCM10009558_044530 [Virgisporangium aurantiacum]